MRIGLYKNRFKIASYYDKVSYIAGCRYFKYMDEIIDRIVFDTY